MTDAAARVIGERFELREVVGRGGMGTVWRAHDTLLDRAVAVKEIPLRSEPGLDLDKVLREAKLAARLSHANAVAVYDALLDTNAVFIVMELVHAPTLQDHVAKYGPLAPAQVAEVGRQLVEVLGEAHRLGIVHRDVKPGNVLLTESAGRLVPRLTDFGIARSDSGDTTATLSAFISGSPAYMAPEQIRAYATSSSDLWSLGATLFYAAEGIAPFRRDTVGAALAAVLSDAPPMPARSGPELGTLLLEMLAKPVDQRPDPASLHHRLTAIAGNTNVTVAQPPRGYRPTTMQLGPPPSGPVSRDGWLILAGVLGFVSVLLWPLMYFGSEKGVQRIFLSPVWLARDSAVLSGLTKVRGIVGFSTPEKLVPLLLAVPIIVITMSVVYGILFMTKSRARIRAADLAGMTAWWGVTAYSALSLALTAEGRDAYKEPTLVLIPWALPGLVCVIALARVIRHEWGGLSLLRQRAVFTALAALCGVVLLVVNLRLASVEPVGVVVYVLVYIGIPVLATLLHSRRAAYLLLANWALAVAAKLFCDKTVLEYLGAYGFGRQTASGFAGVSVSIGTSATLGFVASAAAIALAVVLNIRLRRAG